MYDRTVSVQVFLSPEDYCTIQNKSTLKLRIILSVLLPFIISGIALQKSDISLSGRYVVIGVLMLALVPSVVFLAPKMMKDIWLRQYNSYKTIQKEQLFVISSESIECFSETGVSRYVWNDLYALKETDEAFYIYLSMNQFFYIPKKSFDIDEDDVLFVRECFSNLTDYKRKLKQDKSKSIGSLKIFITATLIICAVMLLIGFILLLFMILMR